MQNNKSQTTKADYQRISIKEFYKITLWALGFVYKLYPVRTIIWLLTSITGNVQSILYTLIFAKAVDQLIKTAQSPNASLTALYPYIWYLLLYNIITTLLSFINRQAQGVIRQTSRPKIRQSFYIKLNSLGIETLEQPGINDKITRAEDYLSDIMPFLQGTMQLIAQVAGVITSMVIVFTFMPLFAVIVVLASVPYLIFDKSFRKKAYKLGYENTEERRRTAACASDMGNINKLPEIITTGAFVYLDNVFISFQTWLNNRYVKVQTQGRIGGYSLGFLTDLVVLWGYVQIFAKLLASSISVGSVLFWMRTFDNLQQVIGNATSWFNDQFEMSIQLKDTYTLFNTEPAFQDGTRRLGKLEKGPEIEFMNVSFKYPRTDRYIFENLNLKIKSGEKIAIVGPNGAGKTTLTKLISRFYPVDSGHVLINHLNVNDLQAKTLYDNMGVLFQEFNQYPQLSVKENIHLGDPEKPLDEVKVRIAAQTADAMQFISAFPDKFDQLLDPRFKGGIKPSTGQWQKLAIARFFYRNAPLVIFDEPTASIDAISEYNIFNKIYEFFEDKTVIIISHRFSTVRNADRIIVINEGKIIEEGNHTKLMAIEDGKYKEAFTLQAEGYRD